jgi:UDP-N-acetylglucosamine 2-epimerase (non-hydrolysing)
LLVLRDKTERPEGIAAGASLLVGTDAARITAEVRRLLDDPAALAAMSRPALPFGDGGADERLAAITARWLNKHR